MSANSGGASMRTATRSAISKPRPCAGRSIRISSRASPSARNSSSSRDRAPPPNRRPRPRRKPRGVRPAPRPRRVEPLAHHLGVAPRFELVVQREPSAAASAAFTSLIPAPGGGRACGSWAPRSAHQPRQGVDVLQRLHVELVSDLGLELVGERVPGCNRRARRSGWRVFAGLRCERLGRGPQPAPTSICVATWRRRPCGSGQSWRARLTGWGGASASARNGDERSQQLGHRRRHWYKVAWASVSLFFQKRGRAAAHVPIGEVVNEAAMRVAVEPSKRSNASVTAATVASAPPAPSGRARGGWSRVGRGDPVVEIGVGGEEATTRSTT